MPQQVGAKSRTCASRITMASEVVSQSVRGRPVERRSVESIRHVYAEREDRTAESGPNGKPTHRHENSVAPGVPKPIGDLDPWPLFAKDTSGVAPTGMGSKKSGRIQPADLLRRRIYRDPDRLVGWGGEGMRIARAGDIAGAAAA